MKVFKFSPSDYDVPQAFYPRLNWQEFGWADGLPLPHALESLGVTPLDGLELIVKHRVPCTPLGSCSPTQGRGLVLFHATAIRQLREILRQREAA